MLTLDHSRIDLSCLEIVLFPLSSAKRKNKIGIAIM